MKLFFKFKIALLSFAMTGTLLTVFGIAFFAFLYSTGFDRMDRELRTLVEAPLMGGHPDDYWVQYGNSIRFIQGEGSADELALMVIGIDDHILFKTANAPAQFAHLPRPEIPNPQPDESNGILELSDGDGDQRISRSEFPGPSERFRVHDTNSDGYISGDELQSLPAPQEGPPQRRGGPRRELRRREIPLPSVSRFMTYETPTVNWRIGIFRTDEITLVAAMDMDSFNAETNRFRTAFMIAVPLGLVILGILGWFLAGHAMKPVAAIADTVEGITAKGLDKRIPMISNDIELERLVTVSNNMLDRLEKSYHQAVRFSADAAHELQTPLTILQGELDNAIQSADDGSTEQQRYSMLLEELRNLKAVVQKLLLLAHADEGRLNVNRVPVDLSELVANAAEDIELMAPKLELGLEIAEGIVVSGDPALLNQTIRNMTSNAAKYAKENGRAIFALKREAGFVHFTLANTAAPIPDTDRPLLFERFHRVDKARTAAGSGLGLSLAREIARAHGGDLVLDPYDGFMVSFTLTLPLV